MKPRQSAPERARPRVSNEASATGAIDRLRTVEFRQTLRGYHIDDVDSYLEEVAVEAEALLAFARPHGPASLPSPGPWTRPTRTVPGQPAANVGPHRATALVTCMDSRLEASALFGFEAGDAHVVRNAGDVVTDDVIRSLAISQRQGHTRTVLVVQHTECAMERVDDKVFLGHLRGEAGSSPSWHTGAFADPWTSVRHSCHLLRACPFLLYRDDIHGYVYDMKGGTIEEVDPADSSSMIRTEAGSKGATWAGWW